jgi:L,D-transpeptidase ErfK/SrfK
MLHACQPHNPEKKENSKSTVQKAKDTTTIGPAFQSIYLNKNITVKEYFKFMDSIVVQYDSVVSYALSEHVLARYNSWIIDTLAHTDYYNMIARDSFVYDQQKMIVLPKGSTLFFPDASIASVLFKNFEQTEIDINIPECKLRIYQDEKLLYTFPIRVGQNRKRYLAMNKRTTDLRTELGTGKIINHVKYPDFYNPVNGKQFFTTKRDDGRTTRMPQIPWMVTEINGRQNGQMIHPTTNPITLGKAYSNGCIGTREGDAWIIYYYAPIGTKITIRYDLETIGKEVSTTAAKDLYHYFD